MHKTEGLLTLVIAVRFHEGRYHGSGSWPPAPARLFQALIAGAGLGGPLSDGTLRALQWLETLDAPVIGAPTARNGQAFRLYLPNNDLDSVGGDPSRIAKIRGAVKEQRPRIFDCRIPLLYAWNFHPSEGAEQHAVTISWLAERVYQLGRGIDFAWGWADVLQPAEFQELVGDYVGTLYHPTNTHSNLELDCPVPGSVARLRARKYTRRFSVELRGRRAVQVFTQAPRPLFAPTYYDGRSSYFMFGLTSVVGQSGLRSVPLPEAVNLTTRVRDSAVRRLRQALPDRTHEIDQVLIGRRPDGSNDGPVGARIRIMPMPSIGHYHADHSIRRVLVVVPATCPVRADDIEWAFSGLPFDQLSEENGRFDAVEGKGDVGELILSPVTDAGKTRFMRHYGIVIPEAGLRYGTRSGSRRWQTVTAAALAPLRDVSPRRVASGRRRATGSKRRAMLSRLTHSVTQALRHAGVQAEIEQVSVQKESFSAYGEPAESFATGTRFTKDRLWHIDIVFAEPLTGPLVLGDGRFLGLGVMVPVRGT